MSHTHVHFMVTLPLEVAKRAVALLGTEASADTMRAVLTDACCRGITEMTLEREEMCQAEQAEYLDHVFARLEREEMCQAEQAGDLDHVFAPAPEEHH